MTKNSQIFLEQQVNLTMRATTMTVALVLWEKGHWQHFRGQSPESSKNHQQKLRDLQGMNHKTGQKITHIFKDLSNVQVKQIHKMIITVSDVEKLDKNYYWRIEEKYIIYTLRDGVIY